MNDLITLKIKGSNGKRFSIVKNNSYYEISCCKRSVGIRWSVGPKSKAIGWTCAACGNELDKDALQIK